MSETPTRKAETDVDEEGNFRKKQKLGRSPPCRQLQQQTAVATQIHPSSVEPMMSGQNETTQQFSLQDSIQQILQGQKKVDNSVIGLQGEVKTFNTRLTGLEFKIDTLTTDLNIINESIEKMSARLNSVESDLKDTKLEYLGLQEEVGRMAKQFRDMKDAQLRSMEHTFDNYLILRGIPEGKNETTWQLQANVNALLKEKIGAETLCTSAHRLGRTENGARPTRVYWVNKNTRNTVLKSGKKLLPIKISKDLPAPVRQVQAKIRTKGWELRQKSVNFQYNDLGLTVNGNFVHHSEIVLDADQGNMDTLA